MVVGVVVVVSLVVYYSSGSCSNNLLQLEEAYVKLQLGHPHWLVQGQTLDLM